MSDLEEISNDTWITEEYRIRDHVIARLRLDQPQPTYIVGDRAFDNIVRRLGLPIGHAIGHAARDGSRVAFVDYNFGTSTARIFAGGPKILDGVIEVIEP